MPTCLVTGASRGLGLEFVKQYAAEGWRVIATCRKPEEAPALAALQGDVRIEPLDVTDFARIETLGRRLDGLPIDLVINNAGIYGPRVTRYDSVDYAAWPEVLRVNVMAPLKVTAVLAPNLAASGLRIAVGISSLMGSIEDNTSGGSYIYRSSKAALHAVTRSLAIDLRSKKIIVCVLNPGWVRTDMGGSAAMLDPFESVAGMRDVIARLTLRESGHFFNYDGTELPW
ncbi:MAG: SDR family oxidoreductase [Rhodospirillales bacterium]